MEDWKGLPTLLLGGDDMRPWLSVGLLRYVYNNKPLITSDDALDYF
jgi:hypothetical protein